MNVVASMRENNSAKSKRTVRHRCKIGAAQFRSAPNAAEHHQEGLFATPARTSAFGTPTRIAVFPPWFSGLRGGQHPAVPGN
jgi:hypothetical protein